MSVAAASKSHEHYCGRFSEQGYLHASDGTLNQREKSLCCQIGKRLRGFDVLRAGLCSKGGVDQDVCRFQVPVHHRRRTSVQISHPLPRRGVTPRDDWNLLQ